jgi:opacity protein-like surface antigen
MKSHIVALSVAMACTGAFAQSKAKDDSTYMELGYNSGQYSVTELPGLSNANHLLITLGKNMSPNYALEGVYANGMSDSSTTSPGTTVNVRLASSYGLYVKPKLAISDSIEMFARVGYFNFKANSTVPAQPSSNDSANGTSLSYGLGASMKIVNNIYGNLDWMQMYKKDGVDIKGMGLSVGYKF